MNTYVAPARRPFRVEKLAVWQEARALNRDIYGFVQTLPADERYGLASQVRRASVSISANIAEGAGRNSDRDFAHFLEQAYGSAMELASHLFLASDLRYIDESCVDRLLSRLDGVAARIVCLNRSLAVKGSKVKL